MNPLNRLSQFNARTTAAYLDWKAQQGSALVWPKADQIALYCVAVVLALMCTIYALPQCEATIWLQTNLFFWVHTAIGACILVATFIILSRAIGAGIVEAWQAGKERSAELQAIPAGETQQIEAGDPEDWTYTGKMSPLLSPMDKMRISQSTNPKLNEQTAATVKACLAAGLTTAETSRETGLSLDTVKKYAALIRKGFDSPALSVDL